MCVYCLGLLSFWNWVIVLGVEKRLKKGKGFRSVVYFQIISAFFLTVFFCVAQEVVDFRVIELVRKMFAAIFWCFIRRGLVGT